MTEEDKKEEEVAQPKPLTDEQTYADVRPTTDPRATHVGHTEAEEKELAEEDKKEGDKPANQQKASMRRLMKALGHVDGIHEWHY